MFGILVAGVVGYYAGLYTFLWSQLTTTNHLLIKNQVKPDNLIKYKQL